MKKIPLVVASGLVVIGLAAPGLHAADRDRPGDNAGNGRYERHVERESRFVQVTIDALKRQAAVAREEMGALERDVEAVTPLESPQRERDFMALAEWYQEYQAALADQILSLEDLEAASRTDGWDGAAAVTVYAGIEKKHRELAKQLEALAKRFEKEERRLAGIVERRAFLKERRNLLEERLRDHGGDRWRAEKIQNDLRVVQDEYLALPQVDEDLLKHYAVLVERSRGESEWMALKRDELGAFKEAAGKLEQEGSKGRKTLAGSYVLVIRALETERTKAGRKSDELYRRRARVTPAGSLREVELSEDLADFYQRLRGRYEDEVRRLTVVIGACSAELAQITSEQ